MENYQILPLRFEHFNENEYFLSNDVGEFEFLTNKDFDSFVSEKLDKESDVFLSLKSKQFLSDTNLEAVTNMLATKFRTKKSILNDFTSLHMVVPTLRCNSDCIYCQVSKKDLTDKGFDMSKSTAKKIVKTIFESPSPVIKIEFQGGEPLTDFEMVQYIMEEAEWQNLFKKKHLEFVICTNLSLITPEMLKYLKKHKCYISTSLDGTRDLHNTNRPLQDTKHTHELFEEKLKLTRAYLGKNSVSALMTTTCYSLGHFKEIVDEYRTDLLFYHTRLKCYVIIALKTKKFEPEFVGKLNFYITAVNELVKDHDDKPTIGMLLCKNKNNYAVEFSLKDVNNPIGVSTFHYTELTDDMKAALPSAEELQKELFNFEQAYSNSKW